MFKDTYVAPLRRSQRLSGKVEKTSAEAETKKTVTKQLKRFAKKT